MPDKKRADQAQLRNGMKAMDLFKLLGELYRQGEAGFSDYGQLQARFDALKQLAGDDTEKTIRLDEVDRLVREAQIAARTGIERAADEYLEQLATADPYYADVEKACFEIYGSQPVYHEEFTADTQGSYTREQFEILKPFSLEDLNSGVSEEEYAALVHLATADPKRCSDKLELGGVYYMVNPSENLIFDNAAPAGPALLGHDKVTLADGTSVRAPRTGSGPVFEELIEPARQDVKTALEAYGKGDREPLAKLIATGITSQMENFDISTGIEGKIDRNTISRLKLILKALPLLDKDPKLMDAARMLGLKSAHMTQLRGLGPYIEIRLAGEEAEKRLRECGEGARTLTAFEREQCALAVVRKRIVTEEAEYSKYVFEQSDDVQRIDQWLDEQQKAPSFTVNVGDETTKRKLTNKYLSAFLSGAKMRASEAPEIVTILGKGGSGVLEGVTARNAQFYRELFTAEGQELVKAVDKAADITVSHDGKQIKDRAAEKPIRTTAREVYAQLTEDYNKRRISYALYDARIQTMRELTKGNPEALIDLATIDRGIMDAPQSHAKQLEESLKALDAEAAPDNDLQRRVNNVLGIYSSEPRSDSRSIGKGYKQEEFDQLKKISIDGMNIGGQPVSPDEFAAISVISALHPDIGGKYTEVHYEWLELPKEQRGYNVSVRNHTHYTTDIDQGRGARPNTGQWILRVVPDARSKAEAALKAYGAQPPQKEMLASLIGQGVQAAASSLTFGGDNNRMFINKEMLADALLTAKLLPVLEKDPELKTLAMKQYGLKEEQIKNLRGCEEAFKVQRTAELAQKKIEEAAKSGKALSRSEKEVCIEAILRKRLLAVECAEYSDIKKKENEPQAEKLGKEMTGLMMRDSALRTQGIKGSEEQVKIASRIARINEEMYDLQAGSKIGLSPLIREMADKGPEILGQKLAERMPGKAALLSMNEKDLSKLFASEKDLINDKEYKELKAGVWVQDAEAKKALEAHKAKQPGAEEKTRTM